MTEGRIIYSRSNATIGRYCRDIRGPYFLDFCQQPGNTLRPNRKHRWMTLGRLWLQRALHTGASSKMTGTRKLHHLIYHDGYTIRQGCGASTAFYGGLYQGWQNLKKYGNLNLNLFFLKAISISISFILKSRISCAFKDFNRDFVFEIISK